MVNQIFDAKSVLPASSISGGAGCGRATMENSDPSGDYLSAAPQASFSSQPRHATCVCW